MVNRALQNGALRRGSSGNRFADARREYVSKDDDFGGGAAAFGRQRTAAAQCATAIATFEAIITGDAETGNLNKGVHRRIVGELAGVKASCGAGRDAEASRALAGVKARHGYR